MTPRRALLWTLALVAGWLPPAAADVYRWTDAQGQVHFSGDLGEVPPAQRDAARRDAPSTGSNRVQTYSSAPAALAPVRPSTGAGANGAPRVHRIQVERAGSGMVVMVRLNGRAVAPFLLDTGASYVLVPKQVADEVGVKVGPDTRKMRFATANGVVEQPIVMLDSVELGDARADDVPASISPSLGIGLLGLSFFNRFTYQIDAAAGLLTLTDNDLADSGGILGGRSEGQWRGEFMGLRVRLEELEAHRTATPPGHGRQLDRLDQEHAALERQIELLDAEADRAQVPDAWRR
jgi:clan AA aspartic protease (TIGR02281 family)